MITRLEKLPNELLWFVMEYVPPLDLFQAFWNLNERLNTILRSIHFRFNLFYTNQKQFDYFLHSILPNIQCNWIESLSIDDISTRLQTIKICHNLRSLNIDQLHTENLQILAKNILPELKQLYYLRLCSEFVLKNEDVDCLSSVIFSEEMPSLASCSLAFQEFGRMNFDHLDPRKKTFSLKTLVIDQWCHLRDFIQLLCFIPNIQRLTVRLFDSHTKGTIIRSLNTMDDFTPLVPHLIYLRAKLSQISFSIASKILLHRLPSHLHELSLSTWSIGYAQGDLWETLLSSKFPHLKHFGLIISLDQIPPHHPTTHNTDLDHLVQSFNQSKYFLDHHWHVLLNINERDRLKFVLHSIPYPIENFQTTLSNIRRCTSTMISSAYPSVRKLSLTLHDDLINDHLEQRSFPNVNQLIFLSNLSDDSSRFQSKDYFHRLKTMIKLSNITSLNFPEVTQSYPIELMHLLLKNLPKLHSFNLAHRLYVHLEHQWIPAVQSLTLIFAIYSSISPPVTRTRYLLSANQILTNDLILSLVRKFSSSNLQSLTLLVRDLDGFDDQFSQWLSSNFPTTSYDLFFADKIVRFYF